jgi:hypothetical protein
MDAAKGYRIYSGGKISIKVADGTYTGVRNRNVNFNHPDGEFLEVIGNETTPANVVIQSANPPDADCFSVTDGHTLGKLNGFTISSPVHAGPSNKWTGILASNNSTIVCGTKMVVSNFYYGIAARNGSVIYCNSANVNFAGDVGIWSYNGSFVDATSATSNNASDTTTSPNLGYGFQAERGSTLICDSGSATGNQIAGVASLSNGTVSAAACVSSSNTGSGFYANQSSTIYASGATCNTNTRWGVELFDSSSVAGIPTGGSNTGNTLGQYSFSPATLTAATYTATESDTYLIANRAGTTTYTLLPAASYPGKTVWMRTIQAQTVVSASANVVPRAGGAAGTAILPATAGAWALLVSDGANWQMQASS